MSDAEMQVSVDVDAARFNLLLINQSVIMEALSHVIGKMDYSPDGLAIKTELDAFGAATRCFLGIDK